MGLVLEAMGLVLWVVEVPVPRPTWDHLWVAPPYSVAQAEQHHRMVVAYLLAVQAEHHHYHWMAASSSPAVVESYCGTGLYWLPPVLVAADPVASLATARMPVARVVVGMVVDH